MLDHTAVLPSARGDLAAGEASDDNEAGIDCWLALARENNNDPLAKFIGAEGAVGLAAYFFTAKDHSLKKEELILIRSGGS